MPRVDAGIGALALAVVVDLAVRPASAQPTTARSGATNPHGREQQAPTARDQRPAERPPEDRAPEDPALPEGMTLDEVLSMAEEPRPDAPDPVVDDRLLALLLVEQFEYRFDGREPPDLLGWEANAWVGGDRNRLWLKPEGEATFHSPGGIETETDVLYSRLVFPFWSVQMGLQYAAEWTPPEGYADRWSGALAFQGLFPGKFEVDTSVYLSQDLDITAVLELEYDWRITQRLVAQPRAEVAFSFQEVPARNLGAGLSEVKTGVRLRYEIKREFAPYLGVRYEAKTFATADRAGDAGQEVWRLFGLVGMRFAFL